MNYRKWFRNCILIYGIIIVLIALTVIIVDPYFHYHKPIVQYRLMEPRYSNDGISRHFDFDAVIIGTSMSQNFKTSQFDSLFDCKSIKLPYEGAGYEELSKAIDRTLQRNPQVEKVLWVLDYNGLLRKPDWSQYDSYPNYLYDDNPLNDFPYLLNKDVLIQGVLPDIINTIKGNDSTTMDEYSAWDVPCGPVVMYNGRHTRTFDGIRQYTKEDRQMVTDTFNENIVNVVNKYPNVQFYMYYTPYSIYNWEALEADGNIDRTISAQETATEILLQCPNIKLYSFFEQTDIIANLYYYRDEAHYNAEVSEMILNWINEDFGLITEDNYKNRIVNQRIIYEEFDYDYYFETLNEFVEQMRLYD